MNEAVLFAVVGHPNKGKSSLVSTLSRNDQIEVSPRSGTTTKAHTYRVAVMNLAYELVDTPGFQRPRQVLHWLQANAENASERPQAVRSFVSDTECQRAFPDEVELLKPIVDGAAIIYVVDGSIPYGPEYEAEMEILRWCGQPRLALINPIRGEDYVSEWRDALDQYFSVVKVFNPFQASLHQQQQLLQAFTVIAPQWQKHLEDLQQALLTEIDLWCRHAAERLAQLIVDSCYYSVQQKVLDTAQAEATQTLLKVRYEKHLRNLEQQAHGDLQHIFRHMQSRFSVPDLDLPPDLFDVDQWFLWGLNRTQLMTSMAVGGMVAGGAIDLALGGASLMMGSVIGGVTGLASAWLSTDKLAKWRPGGLPTSGYEATYGPMKDFNFPYVLINRYVHLFLQISQRTHADRREQTVQVPEWQDTMSAMPDVSVKALQDCATRLVRQKYVATDRLSEVLFTLLQAVRAQQS